MGSLGTREATLGVSISNTNRIDRRYFVILRLAIGHGSLAYEPKTTALKK